MKALQYIWKHRMEWMVVVQIMVANLVTADLVTGLAMKLVLYFNSCLMGIIALHNKWKERRDERIANQPEEKT